MSATSTATSPVANVGHDGYGRTAIPSAKIVYRYSTDRYLLTVRGSYVGSFACYEDATSAIHPAAREQAIGCDCCGDNDGLIRIGGAGFVYRCSFCFSHANILGCEPAEEYTAD